jgi:hypothetical protein
VAKRMGADVVLNFEKTDVIAEIKRLTDGKGVDVAIEALGTQNTFENALRALREPFAAGLGDHDYQDRYDTLSWEQRANARADGARPARAVRLDTPSHSHVFSGQDHRGVPALWRAARGCDQGRDQTVAGFLGA